MICGWCGEYFFMNMRWILVLFCKRKARWKKGGWLKLKWWKMMYFYYWQRMDNCLWKRKKGWWSGVIIQNLFVNNRRAFFFNSLLYSDLVHVHEIYFTIFSFISHFFSKLVEIEYSRGNVYFLFLFSKFEREILFFFNVNRVYDNVKLRRKITSSYSCCRQFLKQMLFKNKCSL